MQYYVDDQGIHYYGVSSAAELTPIDQSTALETLERIAAELEALDLIPPAGEHQPDDLTRERIKAQIFSNIGCECVEQGARKCGACDE